MGIRSRLEGPLVTALLLVTLGTGAAQAASVSAISAGGAESYATYGHTCAVVDGGLQCWGANGNGQLGVGLVNRRIPVPSRVLPPGSGVTAVAAGADHTCAVRSGGVDCWGRDWGQLYEESAPSVPHPTPVPGLPMPATAVAAGLRHACAIARGQVWCWGSTLTGSLGRAIRTDCGPVYARVPCETDPGRVAGITGVATALALGSTHSCALADGVVWCWGGNTFGQLGDGTRDSRFEPRPVTGLPGPAEAISAGGDHTCALVRGDVFCWGRNGADGPRQVAGVANVRLLASGGLFNCALSERTLLADRVQCWTPTREPTEISGLGARVIELAVGVDHACALAEDGKVACWGHNDFGQVGDGVPSVEVTSAAEVIPWDRGQLRDRNRDGRIVIACVGDSNTTWGLWIPSWCDLLDDMLTDTAWSAVRRGWGGATAIEVGSFRRAIDPLDHVIEFDDADVAILAFGTNDLLRLNATPEQVAFAYLALQARAREGGLDVFVALTPPIDSAGAEVNEKVRATNARIRETVDASRIVDFFSGMTDELFIDGVHLKLPGQRLRAKAAHDALLAVAVSSGKAP